MKYVGEAVHEFAVSKDKQVLLGIANWTTIYNRDLLCKNFRDENVNRSESNWKIQKFIRLVLEERLFKTGGI